MLPPPPFDSEKRVQLFNYCNYPSLCLGSVARKQLILDTETALNSKYSPEVSLQCGGRLLYANSEAQFLQPKCQEGNVLPRCASEAFNNLWFGGTSFLTNSYELRHKFVKRSSFGGKSLEAQIFLRISGLKGTVKEK